MINNNKIPWNKGFTKENHLGVAKISATFKKKGIDNFSQWRSRMIQDGLIRSSWPIFDQNGDLAELIGVVLGDGHIGKFPRTEILAIFSNANNRGFINRYSSLIEKVFDKKTSIAMKGETNCVKISIYQKDISKRLDIPTGSRRNLFKNIPEWILAEKEFLIRYLRGLYEAEGSFCVHKSTYTYKFIFSNRNESLLDNVFKALIILGFHPHRSKDKIQISRKNEVFECKSLLKFREY